jgi:L-ascorbate metabolism protein UlaG (beta-lactamase superfamily)
MDITYLGHSCFKLRGREASVVTDPPGKSTGYTIGRPTADVVTISHDHEGHNNVKAVKDNPRVVQGPGEFEVSGVLISGTATFHDNEKGAERGKNTAYVMELDDMRICHLGDLGHIPTADQAEELSGVDILFVPVGDGSTIGAADAAETVSLLGPKLVIPMHYGTPASKEKLDPLDKFLKEIGSAKAIDDKQPKLSVTKTTLPQETKVQVMEYRGSD